MEEKRNKLIVILYLYIMLIVLIFLPINIAKAYKKIELNQIKFMKYNRQDNTIEIKVIKKKNFFSNKFACVAFNDQDIIKNNGIDDECLLKLPANQNYLLYLSSHSDKSDNYVISDYLENILDFKYKKDTIYLTIGETSNIEYTDVLIDKKKINYEFTSANKEIVSVDNNKITALNTGETYIYSSKTTQKLKVIVTNIISKPVLSETKKDIIPCNVYNEEENALLDILLANRINEAGLKTRAGAVAAARFLTLEFIYRVPYFYENGRIHSSGVHFVDGEGRYYHEGLYLNKTKTKSIKSTYSGPAVWGCPLTNWEKAPEYGYYSGAKMPNGLDCSGFVSWVLKNAGFDPGDIGAGESEYPHQMTDLGDYQKLTNDLIASNKIKTGDLVNFWGHIAIIIGIDDNNYYVAESLPYLGGVIAKKYSKKTINNTFDHVVLMDEYYKKEGNYTKMWS